MIILYSFGGCGTRTLYEFIKQYKPINGPVDVHNGFIRFKTKESRVLYLYGNPMEAVMSFYKKHEYDKKFIHQHARHLKIPKIKADTLNDYIIQGKDQFKLCDHFEKYTNKKLRLRFFPIMYIKYEELWNNLEFVLDYISLKDKIHLFPQKKIRESNLNSLSNWHFNKFYKIYEKLINKMDKYPGVKIM